MIGSNVFGQAQQAQTQARDIYGSLSSFSPKRMQAAKLGDAQTMEAVGQVGTPIAAGQLADVNYSQYMSPYTQEVIERGEADIARQRERALNALGAQASAAGAFGGSRFGLAEGETYGQYGRMAGDFAAQQRQQAFGQAQQAAQYDIGQRMQAQQLNQQAAEMGAAREQAARTGNMQAANQFAMQQAQLEQAANQANLQSQFTAANIQSGAAGGLTGLGSQMFGQGLQGIAAQQRSAALAQQQQQQMLDAARQQTLMNLGYPGQALQTGTSILGGLPRAGVTQAGSPGLFGILSGIGSIF
jgi:hypothetical protein